MEVRSDSDDSILELETPTKPPPVLIELDTHMVLNLRQDTSTATDLKRMELPRAPLSAIQDQLDNNEFCSPYHWTQDMKKFYDEEDNDDDFDLNAIQSKMDNIRSLWHSGPEYNIRHNRKRKLHCFNCGRLGHDERQCRPICCVMCGDNTHYTKFCPKKMCLSCGRQFAGSYVSSCSKCSNKRKRQCLRCGIWGHTLVDCTDHWRRFHHITSYQHVLPPTTQVHKIPSELWCCNCAKKGHVEVDCRARKDNTFSPTSTIVSSYVRTFDCDKADRSVDENHSVCISPPNSNVHNISGTNVTKRTSLSALRDHGPASFSMPRSNLNESNISGTNDKNRANLSTHLDYNVSTTMVSVPRSNSNKLCGSGRNNAKRAKLSTLRDQDNLISGSSNITRDVTKRTALGDHDHSTDGNDNVVIIDLTDTITSAKKVIGNTNIKEKKKKKKKKSNKKMKQGEKIDLVSQSIGTATRPLQTNVQKISVKEGGNETTSPKKRNRWNRFAKRKERGKIKNGRKIQERNAVAAARSENWKDHGTLRQPQFEVRVPLRNKPPPRQPQRYFHRTAPPPSPPTRYFQNRSPSFQAWNKFLMRTCPQPQ